MNRSEFGSSSDRGFLTMIHEGMDVYDINNEKIGTVERVYLGSTGEEEIPGTGPAGISRADDMPEDDPFFIDFMARGLGGTEDSGGQDLLRSRLLREGFVRVEGGFLFGKDRYVMDDQIARVDDDGVKLNVAKENLIDET